VAVKDLQLGEQHDVAVADLVAHIRQQLA